MGTSSRALASRRWIGGLVRAGLILVAILFVGGFVWRHLPHRRSVTIVRATSGPEAPLGPGDLRIYNRDSTVDLVLRGAQVLAGLSPRTVARVQAEMARSAGRDTSGIGGLIASTVKQTVASTIGTHVAYPVADIRDMRYESGQLIIERTDGSETRLFGDTKIDHREPGKSFEEADARRFIDAVRARRRALGMP